MSQENVICVRQTYDAFDRRDRAAWLARLDPAFEVVPPDSWPEPGVVSGREAAWDLYMDVADVLGGMDTTNAEIIDAGGDNVVVHRGDQILGRSSGASVAFSFSTVVTFREGKIVRDRWFADRAEALEAAGLSE